MSANCRPEGILYNNLFEEEMNNIRVTAPEFGRANPTLAPFLDGDRTDPDVERLLEAMAFNVALLRRTMAGNFPELVRAMTSLILPHYQRPFPATTVIGFTTHSPEGQSSIIPRGTLFDSAPVDGTRCTFATAATVEITPLKLVDAAFVQHFDGAGEIRLELTLEGLPLSRWQPRMPLRLHLSGDFTSATGLHLLLSRQVTRITLTPRDGGAACVLPPDCLRPSGFSQGEALIPYPSHAFPGYRLLQEYFHSPQKFLSFDLSGWERWQERGAGTHFTIVFHLDSLPFAPQQVRHESFTLHAVMAVNLFSHDADPISIHHRAERYPVRAAGSNPAHYRIFSVDRVTGYSRSTSLKRDYTPFEQFGSVASTGPSFHVTQSEGLTGLEAYLSVSYPEEMPPPDTESLSIALTCTNGSLPESLRVGDITNPLGTLPDFVTARNITPIIPGQTQPPAPGLLRKLISHLSLNQQSLEHIQNLRALLELYVHSGQESGAPGLANLKRISGIESLQVTTNGETVAGFPMECRDVSVRLRQDHFAGPGDLNLFGCVLDHFLGGYAATNTCTRLTFHETTRGEVYRWPMRLGNCNEAGLGFQSEPSGLNYQPGLRGRENNATLAGPPAPTLDSTSLLDNLLSQGHAFSFYQVMRIARHSFCLGGKEHVAGMTWQERLRLRPELSLAFPASDVALVQRHGTGLRVENSFLKLLDCLPTFYTEDLMDEAAADSSVTRDFLDIFHQRLYLVFWECVNKAQFFNQVLEERNPVYMERLFCLIGPGEKELRDGVPDACRLLRHIPLQSLSPHSALGLQTLLRDEFGMSCLEVEQCVPRRAPIPEDQRTRIGVSCCTLGVNTVLGSELADRKGKIRIHIGPLETDDYNAFLPGTTDHAKLAQLVRHYLNAPLEFDLNLKLAAREAKPLRLGAPGMQLGLNSWSFAGATLGELSTILPLSSWPVEPTKSGTARRIHTPERTHTPTLIDHFQREMTALRDLAASYAENHPNQVSMASGDPGVERTFEGFAFLMAKLRLKLDDDIPEIIHDLIDTLQPNFLRPVPATTVIVFTPKPNCRTSQVIPVGTELKSIPVDGTACRFTTRYPVEIHPLSLLDATYARPPGKSASITLKLRLTGMSLKDWNLKSLRLFLAGESAQAANLYLVLQRYLNRIVMVPVHEGESVSLDAKHLKAVGFEDAEVLFPVSPGAASSAVSLQMMHEYFIQPDKFLFLDLLGWEKWQERGDGAEFEIRFELELLPFELHQVTRADFELFATPAVNVFKHHAESIILENIESEYPIIPVGDKPEHYQIYGIEKVRALQNETSQEKELDSGQTKSLFTPTYQIRHSNSPLQQGLDMSISVVRPSGIDLWMASLNISLLCSNGTLPGALQTRDICISTDTSPRFAVFTNSKAVMRSAYANLGDNALWRLYSLCNLNIAQLNVGSLHAIIGLVAQAHRCDYASSIHNSKQIQGIEDLKVKATDRLFGGSMQRGWEVCIRLNQESYSSLGEIYLLGTLLDIFFRDLAPQSSFTRTIVEIYQDGEKFEWPAKMGRRPLL